MWKRIPRPTPDPVLELLHGKRLFRQQLDSLLNRNLQPPGKLALNAPVV